MGAVLLLGLALGLLLALAMAWAAARLGRRGRSRVARTRAARAQAGERAAEDLLIDAGYAIIGRQVRQTWAVQCDDAEVEVELRCDLLVTDGTGAQLVAEVKTGEAAPRLTTAATRRQLLEYQLAYDARAILLVDPEAGAIHRIEFPMPVAIAPPPRAALGWWLALALAAAVGALAGAAY